MAAKTTTKKKSAGQKATGTAKTGRKTAAKKSAGTSAKSGATTRSRGATGSKTPARKKAAKTSPTKRTAKKSARKAPARKARFTAEQVNLGHVFSLRPRVSTAFRPEDFRTAKHRLREESYVSLEAATRAVVEQAHELGREQPRFAAKRP